MSPRRIRVAGVSADFRVPRGWPIPTDRWIRSNVFWQPPAGWAPRPELKPAPPDWKFWAPNELWRKMSDAHYRRVARWSYASSVLVLAYFAIGFGRSISILPDAVRLLAVPLILAAVICLVMYCVAHRRTTDRLLTELAVMAARKRTERLTHEYQRYLMDVA